jgi:hypothetical protein
MLVLTIQCGNAIQNGIDIAANIIANPIEIMIKSISQTIDLSIQLANTIVLVFDALEDGDGKVYLCTNALMNLQIVKLRLWWLIVFRECKVLVWFIATLCTCIGKTYSTI